MEWIDMRQEKAKKSTINNGKSSDRIIGLVFYYLQQQYKISRTQEKTKYAAMVLEMLGRPTDKIRDSRVYNVLRQPLYHAEAPQAKKALITDLKNVRELFRQIINFEIVKKIDDDIKSLDNLID